MNKIVPLCFTEHESKPKELVPELLELENNDSLNLIGYPEEYMGVPKHLGISSNSDNFEAAYYIEGRFYFYCRFIDFNTIAF